MVLFCAICELSAGAAAVLLSVLGVVAAALEVLSVEEVLGVVFAAAVLSEVLVFGGGAWLDMVLAVGEP